MAETNLMRPDMVKRFASRVAVGDAETLYSAMWRIWCVKNDIYIAARAIGGLMKASLHESGKRHRGFTSDYVSSQIAANQWDAAIFRHFDRWKGGLAISPTLTLEFCISIPASQLRPYRNTDNQNQTIQYIPMPEVRQQIVITILLETKPVTDENWPWKDEDGFRLIAGHQLPNGHFLWVVYNVMNEPNGLESSLEKQFLKQCIWNRRQTQRSLMRIVTNIALL